jgi:hypothetical protein
MSASLAKMLCLLSCETSAKRAVEARMLMSENPGQ